jgi:hypothetical protein
MEQIYHLSLQRTRSGEKREGWLTALLQPRSVVLFVGQGRSGHSLVGSLLDAHPDCLIAHELNVCNLMTAGFDRNQICYLIWLNSQSFARVGRIWGKYSYTVPGAHQGQFRKLSVIGDKKGGSTADYLSQDSSNLERITKFFDTPVCFVHVVRHPLDNIAAMALQAGGTAGLNGAIANYTRRCMASAWLLDSGQADVITLHHEDILSQSRIELVTLARRLGLEIDGSWLDACEPVVARAASRTRDKVTWSPTQRETILDLISRIRFLRRYQEEA